MHFVFKNSCFYVFLGNFLKYAWKKRTSTSKVPVPFVANNAVKNKGRKAPNNTTSTFKLILYVNDNVPTQKLKAWNIVSSYKEESKIQSSKKFFWSDTKLWLVSFAHFDSFSRGKSWKNAKYRFWLQKEVNNFIRQDFLIRDPQIVGSFMCYFCLKITRTLIFSGRIFRPPP